MPKIDNAIFKEWCDQLVACQSDGGLKDTLPAIVSKLRDERLVNSELRTMLAEVRREYYFMVAFVVGNIPLLYCINKEWYLEYVTVEGKTYPAQMWLEYSSAELKAAAVTTHYIKITTADKWLAGTDGDVYIELIGSDGQSTGKILLDEDGNQKVEVDQKIRFMTSLLGTEQLQMYLWVNLKIRVFK